MKHLSARLRFVFEQSGLSQEAFGAIAGASQATAFRWLSGEADPKASSLALLCRALDINGDWLLTGRGSPALPGSESAATVRALREALASSERLSAALRSQIALLGSAEHKDLAPEADARDSTSLDPITRKEAHHVG